MNHEPTAHKQAQAALLERMAASRAALIAMNRAADMPSSHATAGGAARTIVTSLVEAPHVALLLALVAGGIILGPRRILATAGRSGLTWIVRKMVTQ